MRGFIDLFVHLDVHLAELIARYGTWTYAILFAVVFAETGLVFLPLLPGDSLLFAAGTFAALGQLDPWLMIVLLSVAAIVGDTVNYWIGKRIGPRAFSGNIRMLNPKHLQRTRDFFARHGGKAIVLARFVPIVRTFAPFVAGVGAMEYGRFIMYNAVGGIVWVLLLVGAGYWFGNIPVVRDNFTVVILAIVAISALPIAREFALHFRRRLRSSAG